MKYWLITDIHQNHNNVIKYNDRPIDYVDQVQKNWQTIVKEEDTVVNLGDVIFHKAYELGDFMKTLPGTKILVRGNHDKGHTDSWFLKRGYSCVCDNITIKGVLLSHRPIPIGNSHMNVHGHFHNAGGERWESKLASTITDKHFLLSLEFIKYKPVLLEECKRGKHVIGTLERFSEAICAS